MRKLDTEDCCSDQRVICVAVLFGADSGILLTIRSGGIEKAIVRYIMALPGQAACSAPIDQYKDTQLCIH